MVGTNIRWRDERGSATAELVIATPLLLLLILGIVQFALWEHADPRRPGRRRARSRRRPRPRRYRPGRHRRGRQRLGPTRLGRARASERDRHPGRRNHDRRRDRTGRSDPAVLEPAGALGGHRSVGTLHDKRPGTMRIGLSSPGQRTGLGHGRAGHLDPAAHPPVAFRRRPRATRPGRASTSTGSPRRPPALRRSPAVRKPRRPARSRPPPRHSAPSTSPARTWPCPWTPRTSRPAGRWP